MNRQDAELISEEFGRFLTERQPIIPDASLLPYPKNIIMKAILVTQELIRDNANILEILDKRKELKSLNSVISPYQHF